MNGLLQAYENWQAAQDTIELYDHFAVKVEEITDDGRTVYEFFRWEEPMTPCGKFAWNGGEDFTPL